MFSVDKLSSRSFLAMAAKTTLKYIAERLHLSISTVSRALKDHPDISEETKKKVVELANLIDYEPNTFAINLRTNNSRLFAVIVPSLTNNNFYDSFISSIEDEARKSGYSLFILQSSDDDIIESQNLKLARANRVAGIFVALSKLTRDFQPFRKLEDDDIPVIFFDKVPDIDSCNKIRVADEDAARLAASKLLASGRKNVLALFGNPDLQITRKREAVFQELLRPAGTNLSVAYADSFGEAVTKVLESFRSDPAPDAIFAMSDELLTGTMKAIQQLKLEIPKSVAVISISNDGFIPSLYEPSITYVETSGYKLGKLAFQRMQDYLAGKRFYREMICPSVLVEGGSV